MKNSLYNKRHIKEYLLYGLLASVCYIIPVALYFYFSDYAKSWIVFLGSILFMFWVMLYSFKLSRRRTEYKSTWMMIIASHFVIFAGIAFSVLWTIVLCFIYIPGFLSGHSTPVLANAPGGLNEKNSGLTVMLFACATIENFGAAAFIAVLGPYVFKKNQVRDKSALLETHVQVGSLPKKTVFYFLIHDD